MSDFEENSHGTGLLQMVSGCMKDIPLQVGKHNRIQIVYQLFKLCKLL